jgi:hypothetical protein
VKVDEGQETFTSLTNRRLVYSEAELRMGRELKKF